MYLSESKEDVFKNIDIMANKALNKTYQAVAVKLNGEIFCVRDFSIGRPGLSFNEYKNLLKNIGHKTKIQQQRQRKYSLSARQKSLKY